MKPAWQRESGWLLSVAGKPPIVGNFIGNALTVKRVKIRYMDFWKVQYGKIANNWVMVDFPHVMRQLGVDPFNGYGWEILTEVKNSLFSFINSITACNTAKGVT